MKINSKLGVGLGILFCLSANVQAQSTDKMPQTEAKPETKITVTVVGDVALPGQYQVLNNRELFFVLIEAGGLTRTFQLTRIVVVRGKVKISVDAEKFRLGDVSMNLRLQDGDVVMVSRQPAEIIPLPPLLLSPPEDGTIYVGGQVKSAGFRPIPTKGSLTLREAIVQSGGLSANPADLRIVVSRKKDGKMQRVFDLAAPSDFADERWNYVLQKDDVVYVSASRFAPRHASPHPYLWLLRSNPDVQRFALT